MNKRILVFPTDLRPSMYEAIGEYMARAAKFEFQLISGIAALAGVLDPKKRRIAFMGMTFNARLGTFKALAQYWAPTRRLQEQVNSVVASGRRIRQMRNSLAHGVWGYEKGKDSRRLYVSHAPESKDFYLPKGTHYTADKIRAKAKAIRNLDRRLTLLVKRLTFYASHS